MPRKSKELTPIELLDRAVQVGSRGQTERQAFKWWEHRRDEEDSYWTTLQHNGMVFQPLYTPHGVPLYYEGQPIALTPEQEEIATLYAQVGEDAIQLRDPQTAKIFNANFFAFFRQALGPHSPVQSLEKCDFGAIRAHLEAQRKQRVKASAEEKQLQQLRMGYMLVDGNCQKVGNYVVEPPSLFRGRGLHPRMGSVKMRVIPEQVLLNVDRNMAVPACPMPGHNYESIECKKDALWLAKWEDNLGHGKYCAVNASCYLKGQNDMEKYEIARRLKKHIQKIRRSVLENLRSSDLKEQSDFWNSVRRRQLATAIWIIDNLALRVGNEKSEVGAPSRGYL